MLLLAAVAGLLVALSVLLPRALAGAAVLERVFSVCVALYIANSDSLAESKTAKIFLLLLFPWAGAVLILCLPKPQSGEFNPRPFSAEPFSDGKMNKLAALVSSCGLKPCLAERAEYFPDGAAMRDALLSDLAQAKRFIWLEFYIIERGEFWNGVFEILCRKAQEGVDVRLIYDDFGCALTLPRRYCDTLQRENIKAFSYRPLRPDTLNVRDHSKLAVIDGITVYTGGINLADEYIGKKIRFGHWKDAAIKLTGEPARQFALHFERVWAKRYPDDRGEMLRLTDGIPEKAGTIPCVPVTDGEGGDRAGAKAFGALYSAERRLYIATPYLAPDATLKAALVSAARAGADVRIMIPHLPDKKSVFLISRSYARELQRAGVSVREYTAGFMHAKTCIADGKYCAVSSYNLDYRSMYLQCECGAFIEDEKTGGEMERDFLAAWETGTSLPRARALENALTAILRLFAPAV